MRKEKSNLRMRSREGTNIQPPPFLGYRGERERRKGEKGGRERGTWAERVSEQYRGKLPVGPVR